MDFRPFLLIGCLMISGCGEDEVSPICEPGATQPCVGPAGCTGGQICEQDGSAWGACDCGSGQGGGQGCSADGCDDANPCTVDGCTSGSCSHDPLDGDSAHIEQVAGDCQRVSCSAGQASLAADDGDLPVDNNGCTEDLCVGGIPSNPAEPGGSACDQNGGIVCNGQGGCAECFGNVHCTLPETCGGGGTPFACGCTPVSCLALDLTCGYAADDGCGNPLPCNNGIQDGAETDVDCGGEPSTCNTRCNVGQNCNLNPDCATNKCTAGTCQ